MKIRVCKTHLDYLNTVEKDTNNRSLSAALYKVIEDHKNRPLKYLEIRRGGDNNDCK